MSTLSISARPRELRGRHLGELRSRGAVPVVVYGHRQPALALEADAKSLERLWHHAGKSTLVDLEVEGGSTRKVIIREIQFSPRSGQVMHADFYAPNLRVKTVADVPVVLTGEAPAEKLKLGQLLLLATTVRVECLPADLPSQLHGDVSGMEEADAHLLAGDIALPHGVTLLSDPGEVVAKIDVRRGKGMEEEEADAPAEGEAAEAPAAAEGADSDA